MWVARSGSVGTDRSANGAAIPQSGLVQLLQIPVNHKRNRVEVQVQGPGTFQLVRDDGAGANQTSLFLQGPNTSPGPGGSWWSETFKGQLTVYGAAGSTVGAYED